MPFKFFGFILFMSNILTNQKTRFTTNEEIVKQWLLIDAKGQNLGRLASQIAYRLRGKHLVNYAPHQDIGDNIVVINSKHVIVSGNKAKNKIYYKHSGYVGNMKIIRFDEMMAKKPTEALKLAVKRMLPHGPLGKKLLGNLKIYSENEHPHNAQKLSLWTPIYK